MLWIVGVRCSVWNKQMWGQGVDFPEKHWEDSVKYGGRISMSCSHAGPKKCQSEVDNHSESYLSGEGVLRVTDLCCILNDWPLLPWKSVTPWDHPFLALLLLPWLFHSLEFSGPASAPWGLVFPGVLSLALSTCTFIESHVSSNDFNYHFLSSYF